MFDPVQEQWEIRPLAKDEIAAVSRSMGSSHANYFSRRLQYQRARLGFVLVAWEGGSPVGGLFVRMDPPDERAARDELAGVPFLYHAWVREDCRNRGIGTTLLREAHQRLRDQGLRRLALGIDHWNKDAIRLYERIGYEMWEGKSYGIGGRGRRTAESKKELTWGYDIMVLDLWNNDRTRVLDLR